MWILSSIGDRTPTIAQVTEPRRPGAESSWTPFTNWITCLGFLGRPEEVFCCAGKVSTLETHTEDNADILLRFRSGVVATVHLDYLQRTYRRSCELIGEDGVIIWDYIARSMTLYGKQDRHCELFQENINYELNQMYVEELKHFVRCIQGEEQLAVDAAQGREVLQIALAATASAAWKATVTIDR